MAVRKKTGRPRKRKVIKKTESEIKTVEAKQEVKQEAKQEKLFPDRQPIYGGEEYIPADATQLTRDGKPWIPEEHGYVARFMDPDIIDKVGWRDYQPVPVESGIRVADHPLTSQEVGSTQMAGKGIYYHPKTNEAVQEALGGEEFSRLTGGKSKLVKLNSSILALAPIELVQSRRKFAKTVSNNTLEKHFSRAHEEAQEELGNDVTKYGRFSTGKGAERYEMDRKSKSPKKVWSVPTQIS
jgi:hypothetical protein